MSQRDWEELLSAYADGEVTPAERSAVESLLETTPDARAALGEIRSLSQMLRTLPRETAPPELKSTVLQVAETHKTPVAAAATRRFRSYRREWLAGFSAVAATVLMAGLLSLQFRTGLAPQSEYAVWSESGRPVIAAGSVEVKAWGDGEPLPEADRLVLRESGVPASPRGAAMRSMRTADGSVSLETRSLPMPAAAPLDEKQSGNDGLFGLSTELAEVDTALSRGSGAEVERLREVLPYLRLQDENGQSIGNVSLVVIDAQRVANQFQLLLMKNGVQTVDATTVDFDADVALAPAAGVSAEPQKKLSPENGLYAVYTEAPVEPLSKTLEELIQQREVLGLRLQPPLQVSPVAVSRRGEEFSRNQQEGERKVSLKQITDAYIVQNSDGELRDSDEPASALDALALSRDEVEGRRLDALGMSPQQREPSTMPLAANAPATPDAAAEGQQLYFNTLVKLPAQATEQSQGLDARYRSDLRQNSRSGTPQIPSPAATPDDLQQMRSRFARTAPDTVRLLFVFQPAGSPSPAQKSALPSGR
jgi:hypothetical protein